MDRTLNVNQIIGEIEKLNYNDKIKVMSGIVNLLKREEKSNETWSITQLKGLGKSVWHTTGIASYIATERESWD